MVGFNHAIMAFCEASVDDDKIQAKWMERKLLKLK